MYTLYNDNDNHIIHKCKLMCPLRNSMSSKCALQKQLHWVTASFKI